jgi:hypothetical protein
MLFELRFASIGIALGCALVAAVSCGGSTKRGGEGGSSGQGGAGGQAGMRARCTLPSQPGNCNAYFPAFFHNPKNGVCEPFVYGGCGGNDNRFETREECQAACRGGTPDMDVCTTNSDCMVASPACCGNCSGETAHELVGINSRNQDAYHATTGCGGISCGPCPEIDELERTAQYFVSTCQNGACTIVDIRETAVTQCGTDADCELRDGASCCRECDGSGLVAVEPHALADLMCHGIEHCVGCPPPIPPPPPEFVPVCSTGRCSVTRVRR